MKVLLCLGNVELIVYKQGGLLMKSLIADREIAAIIPEYTAQGDFTVLYLRDGSCERLPVKVETVVRFLSERRREDIRLLRLWAGEITHAKLWMPLGISWELVLVPLKVRVPRVEGDSTIGYFNFTQIEQSYSQDESVASIYLRGGQRIDLLWTHQTISKHLQNAWLIRAMITKDLDDALLHRLKI